MLIVADPRKTELAGRADIHLQMQPGTDVALFNAMLHHVIAEGLENKAFVAERMHDFGKVRESVKAMTPDVAAKITGFPQTDPLGRRESTPGAEHQHAVGDGLTQHANGTDLVTSLLNLMLACGMIGAGCRDDAGAGAEQRPGRFRCRRDSLRVHRLPTGQGPEEPREYAAAWVSRRSRSR